MSEAERRHHICLIPGLFGFGVLAGYDYFEHLERALLRRFADAGVRLGISVVSSPPTASISVRAAVLARHLAQVEQAGPVHLLGHSTGGLDARLLLSPGVQLPLVGAGAAAKARVRGVVSINTPHYGTPLAGYFTTVAGTRMLYLLSLLTVMSLGLGRIPLAALSGVLGAISGLDRKLGVQIRFLDEITTQLLRFVGDDGREQILDYLSHVKHDQGGIVHLMPEVMELFNAAVSDAPDVRYGCVATLAPAPGSRRVLSAVGRPGRAFHYAAYTTVHGVAGRATERYPYALPTSAQLAKLSQLAEEPPTPAWVDGIVPTLSMLWGKLLWCGHGDHLDVMGHFGDPRRPHPHTDWLRSGAKFDRADFDAMCDSIANFLLSD